MVSPYPRRTCPRTGKAHYVHRAVAEWKLGRPLRPGEVVHHINGDPTDNHADNLQVLPSQRAHILLEHYQRRERAGIGDLYSLLELLRVHGEKAAPTMQVN